jgi:histidinol-phosphate aminotransferase
MNWREYVRNVTPYVPGEQPKIDNLIKLNTNENPYSPSPVVKDELIKLAEDYDCLRRYPKPDCDALRDALSEYMGISPDKIFTGVGSDDVICTIFSTFFHSSLPVLFADITYSFYEVWAEYVGFPKELIPVKDDLSIDINDYRRENGGIVIANPNAPTGLALPLSKIEEILSFNKDSIVIVDEAYIDFGGESAVKLIDKYDNLIVTQTYSKSRNLAGLRIGMAFASPELISKIKAIKFSINSYTMNEPSLRLASAVLKDEKYFRECCDKVIKTREWSSEEFKKLGFEFPESSSNFVFVTHPKVNANDIYKALRERGILVRHFSIPRIDNYLRISIGTDDEMKALFSALNEIIK